MKVNQHAPTPIPKPSKRLKYLRGFCLAGLYGMFVLLAFCLFRYGQTIVGGLLALLLPAVGGILAVVYAQDMQKSYIELEGDDIRVVDCLFLQKRETRYRKSDIDHTEQLSAFSVRLHIRHVYAPGMQYLVFYGRNGKYLFQLLATPEALEFRRRIIRP